MQKYIFCLCIIKYKSNCYYFNFFLKMWSEQAIIFINELFICH